MKIKKQSFYFGIVLLVLMLIDLYKYSKTSCLKMPQMPEMCGVSAEGYLWGTYILLGISIFMIVFSFKKNGSIKE
jgi:hypothetical protein